MAQKTPVILSDDKRQHTPLADGDTISVDSIPLSADEGNQIQRRDDGLYYGQTAPADISLLYISETLGSDLNAGTRDAPLKTIDRAFTLISERKAPGNYNLRLRAGENFPFTKRIGFTSGVYKIYIAYYDDPIFGDNISHNGYWPAVDDRLQRPKITFDTYNTSNGLVDWLGIALGNDAVLSFEGCDVVYTQAGAGSVTGGGWCHYVSNLQYVGCDISLVGCTEGIGSAKAILTRSCNMAVDNSTQFFISDFTPGWMDMIPVNPGATNTDPTGVGPDCIGRDPNLQDVVTPTNGMALASFDADTKTLFGWQTNWDIFAASAGA